MLANNNKHIINKMAVRSLKSNKRKNFIILLAIALSAFMLFSVFTVGITYFKMQWLQNVRLNGADFDAIMYGLTKEQQEICDNNSDILKTGLIAICGSIVETDADDTVNSGFIYADDIYWNEMMKPAREWVKGNYPKKSNELMATKAALKQCGFENLNIGDSFSATYTDGTGQKHTKEFVISGMWDGYSVKSAFYVSKEFFEQSGYELSDVGCARYFIDFKQKIITEQEQTDFIDSMNLSKQQRLFFTGEFGHSLPLLFGMLALVFITCLCAYLLIYNILYLSVSGNVRYYGLLQTVGMTSKQIYLLINRQMIILGGLGILFGILFASGISFIIIPSIVQTMGIHLNKVGNIEISFSPVVFIVTILLIGFTIYIGSRKPVKMAINITPIEAIGYRPLSGIKKLKKTRSGNLTWRIVKEQVLKDKKKSSIIVLSLAVGLSVFLCLTTMIESQGARTMMSNFMEMDLIIENDTLKKENQQSWKQIITNDFISQIKNNKNIKEYHLLYEAQITVPWEREFSDIWMKEFYDMWMSIPYSDDIEEYKAYPENFGSFLIGIDDKDFDYLNETLENSIDKNDFIRGKTCVLYRNGLEFKDDDLRGKSVTCADYDNSENTRTFEIAGLTDESHYIGALLGTPPTIIVSDRVIKDFVKEPLIQKVSIRYNTEYDEYTENQMLDLMQSSPDKDDFSYESKIEELEYIEKAQGNMMEIGIGIALILALIGIMNYINTVIGNVQNRQVELSILESVGMTDKQINLMLIIEGLVFATSSLFLTATIGLGITYIIYQSMNYRGIDFAVPLIPVLVMVVFIVFICISVPLLTRNILIKHESIVERIRKFER